MGTRRNTLSTKDMRILFKLFEDVIEPVTDNKCKYREGWTDAKVAEALQDAAGLAVTPTVAIIADRRRELYGKLATFSVKRTRNGVVGLGVKARIGLLEDRVKVLEDLLTK